MWGLHLGNQGLCNQPADPKSQHATIKTADQLIPRDFILQGKDGKHPCATKPWLRACRLQPGDFSLRALYRVRARGNPHRNDTEIPNVDFYTFIVASRSVHLGHTCTEGREVQLLSHRDAEEYLHALSRFWWLCSCQSPLCAGDSFAPGDSSPGR